MIRGARPSETPRRFSAVLFDLDGTLVDSSQDLTTALNAALQELGLPPRSHAEVLAFVGDGARELVTRGLPADRVELTDRVLPMFTEHYRRVLLESTRPYPGIPEVLARLRGLPLAVATNKPEELARAILTGLGLAPMFRMIVGGDSLPTRKPDPQVLLTIALRLGIRAEEALLVGDGIQDVEAARRARMTSCGVAWGYRQAELLFAAGAELVIDAPLDLLRVVEVLPELPTRDPAG
jgi:phosphoglycolate phosphatase